MALTEWGAHGRRVVVRDPRTGSPLWDRPGEVTGSAGPTAVLVHDPGERGETATVSALDAATGDVLWVLPVTTNAPTSAVLSGSVTASPTTLVVDLPPRPMIMCE